MKKLFGIITRKGLGFAQGSDMISPNSFCGFVFTRAIDMNLDPPFLYNPLSKNEKNNLIYYSTTIEFYTRFWNDISQLILWICLHKGHIDHRYELRHPNPANSSAQFFCFKNKLIPQPKGVGCQKTLFKTYLKLFDTLPKLVLRRFPLIITSKP